MSFGGNEAMSSLEALAKLQSLQSGVFQTSDAATRLGISNGTASKILSRLSAKEAIIRLARGRWALPDRVDRLAIPEHLTAPWPSYISLHTALYYHGLISQIPAVTYAVSLRRPRLFRNVLGVYSIHQIKPDFFFGYDTLGKAGIKLATPEKALLDVIYLSPARSNLFQKLPEIELTSKFKIGAAKKMISKIQSQQRRSLVEKRFEELIKRLG
jgi:predicted transcriptional regulator of viral defense system